MEAYEEMKWDVADIVSAGLFITALMLGGVVFWVVVAWAMFLLGFE